MSKVRGEVGKKTPQKDMENMTSKVMQFGLRPNCSSSKDTIVKLSVKMAMINKHLPLDIFFLSDIWLFLVI